jgi:hypothetical protein
MTMAQELTFDDLLARLDDRVAGIAREARQLIEQLLPEARSDFRAGHNSLAYSFTGRYADVFLYLAPFKKHVNLGFFHGADLDDPHGLLVGTGKQLRHVKLSSVEELHHEGIRPLIEAAARNAPKP